MAHISDCIDITVVGIVCFHAIDFDCNIKLNQKKKKSFHKIGTHHLNIFKCVVVNEWFIYKKIYFHNFHFFLSHNIIVAE